MNMPIRRQDRHHIIRLPAGERFQLRYVRPDDKERLEEMFSHASPEDARFRLLGAVHGFAAHMAEKFVHLDPETEVAIVATSLPDVQPEEIYGVVHIAQDRPDADTAEYDVMVRSDFKAHGLGYRLMTEIIQCARRRGLKGVTGYISPDNSKMLLMASELGFVARRGEENLVEVKLDFDEFDRRLEEELGSD
ncbi:GNAT family N-acetyltransferase [Methylocella sp.]|uniref:GNAT family N-acetyltransferase n=1 Tax=Methylocella sp. TaxID=1978226 RepID=UPI00378520E5